MRTLPTYLGRSKGLCSQGTACGTLWVECCYSYQLVIVHIPEINAILYLALFLIYWVGFDKTSSHINVATSRDNAKLQNTQPLTLVYLDRWVTQLITEVPFVLCLVFKPVRYMWPGTLIVRRVTQCMLREMSCMYWKMKARNNSVQYWVPIRPVSNVVLIPCRTQFINYKYIRIQLNVCQTVSLFLCFVFGNSRSIRLN